LPAQYAKTERKVEHGLQEVSPCRDREGVPMALRATKGDENLREKV